MATLTIPNTFTNGATIVAAEHNANFTAVKNFVDALSAGTNFDAGAINTEDITDAAITTAKIASLAVTSAKIQTSVSLTTPIIGAATGTSLNTTGNVISHNVPVAVVGALTLALTDDGTIIERTTHLERPSRFPQTEAWLSRLARKLSLFKLALVKQRLLAPRASPSTARLV